MIRELVVFCCGVVAGWVMLGLMMILVPSSLHNIASESLKFCETAYNQTCKITAVPVSSKK